MAVCQRTNHGLFINYLPSSRVDNDTTLLHGPNLFFTNQALGVLTQWHMDTEHVRFLEHFLHVGVVLAPFWCIFVFGARMVNNSHWKSVREDSEVQADPTKT
jgi:hypothetical protein